MNKIWQKKTATAANEIDSFLISKGTPDNILIPYDVQASKAHANMLEKIGVISSAENADLQKGLDEILKLYNEGKFFLEAGDEDCHSKIEKFLIDTYGDTGKKIHTGRSRNDQVLIASRLYTIAMLKEVEKLTLNLAEDFLNKAKEYENVPFPGYTHSQQAMISSLGHYFCSFAESLLDDNKIQKMAQEIINQNPLGSAAGFGVSFALDREMTTKELGLSKVQQNSLYCQTSRGKFESLVLESLVQTMLTLGRFAQDMIIFTTNEFNYFKVDDVMTTGSSIMPQKKNLDFMEVLRGYVSMMIGYQHQIQDITKNQLSGYNKDLKFVKKILIDAFDAAQESLSITGKMLSSIAPNQDEILKKLSKGIFAADIANDLVKNSGIPFRDAYKEALDKLHETEVDIEANIKSKISPGAPGNLGLEIYHDRLKEQRG